MKPSLRRPRPLVVAAILNILLFCGAIIAALASILPTPALPGLRLELPALMGSASEDPPPLTPILDPKPDEPRPVQQIVVLAPPATVTAAR